MVTEDMVVAMRSYGRYQDLLERANGITVDCARILTPIEVSTAMAKADVAYGEFLDVCRSLQLEPKVVAEAFPRYDV